jgi:predicted Zn-dependent protease
MDTQELELREAWLWLVAGEPARAEQQLRKLIAHHPLPDALTAELARVLMLQQRPDAALEALRTGCRNYPALTESREMLVGVLAQSGDWEEAEAVARAGSGAAARVLLARLLLSRGDPRSAATELEEVIRAGDSTPQMLDLLANARIAFGDATGALDALELLQGHGGDAAAYAQERAAALLGAMGELDPAGAWWRRIDAAAK